MFDIWLRNIADPALDRMARVIARTGVRPNHISIAGFVVGTGAALAIAFTLYTTALLLILVNRLCDGLDGAVARIDGKSDFGGFLDIVLDFFFYGSIPFAFALAAPDENALAACALLLSFLANGSVFLSFAILAEKQGFAADTRGKKSLHYMSGLAEGSETIAVFILFCLFPASFALIACGFAVLCAVSAIARLAQAACSANARAGDSGTCADTRR